MLSRAFGLDSLRYLNRQCPMGLRYSDRRIEFASSITCRRLALDGNESGDKSPHCYVNVK